MKVKPANPEAVIRDPHTRAVLPPEGGDVPDSVFWHRRLIAGEIVRIGDEPADNAVRSLTTRGSK